MLARTSALFSWLVYISVRRYICNSNLHKLSIISSKAAHLAALQQLCIAAGELSPQLPALLLVSIGAIQAEEVGPDLRSQLRLTALQV